MTSNYSDKLKNFISSYTEPLPHTTIKPNKKKKKVHTSSLSSSTHIINQDGENSLHPEYNNIGVPIIVVCCKTDGIKGLEKQLPNFKDAQEEYIQV
jgi:hypothetical protein